MKTRTYVVILVALLVLNVPWVITGSEKSSVPGFPGWALYSFFHSLVLAFFICWAAGERFNYRDDNHGHADTDRRP